MADLTCVGRINLYFQKSFERIQRKRKDINKFSTICFVLAILNFQYVRKVSYIGCLHMVQMILQIHKINTKINLEKRIIF